MNHNYHTAETFGKAPDGRIGLDGGSILRDRPTPSRKQHAPFTRQSDPTPMVKITTDVNLNSGYNNLYSGNIVSVLPLASPRATKDNHSRFDPVPQALSSLTKTSKASRCKRLLQKSLKIPDENRSEPTVAVPTASGVVPVKHHSLMNIPSGEWQVHTRPVHYRSLLSGTRIGAAAPLEVGFQNFELFRERKNEFYDFLDSELHKVESFYKDKELQAEQRLADLRYQLHEMHNRRIQEITETQRQGQGVRSSDKDTGYSQEKFDGWFQRVKVKIFPLWLNTRAFTAVPPVPRVAGWRRGDVSRDYIRRPVHQDVPYRMAKQTLKLAMQEFYRSLELLQSYAQQNHTGFRKINKKFDKAVNSRQPYRFMTERVDKAWFVNSDTVERFIKTVEDLYARYFEYGNHKLAASKLRTLSDKTAYEKSGSPFLNGFLIGTGIVLAIQGLICAAQLLFDEDPELRMQTSFLMQLYGAYFLMLVLFSLFCINCFIWTRNKVNYPFIFEFDQSRHMDWRRLSEFPSILFLIFGASIWMNFSRYSSDELYLYYPVALVALTATIILFPLPVLAYDSRRWFIYSHVGLRLDLWN